MSSLMLSVRDRNSENLIGANARPSAGLARKSVRHSPRFDRIPTAPDLSSVSARRS